MDLNTSIQNISSDQLDALFSGGTTSLPNADSLVIGREEGKEPVEGPLVVASDGIPTINLDDYEMADEDKTEAPAEEGKEEDKGTEEAEPAEEEEVEKTDNIPSVLKNTVNFLIEKGIWADFEGREDLEIDEELYAQIAAKQEESKLEDMFGELLDSTGPYGKAIISHIKNGGNPDEIIDIFKEQKQVQNIDLSDEDGQLNVINKYYSEVIGWSKSRIDKHINLLKSEDGELEAEAKDLQNKFEKIYSSQVAQIERAETERKAEKARQQEEYINTLTTTIDTFENFNDKEKRLVKDAVLKFNKKLEDGTPVNEFYLKFYEIQRDPKEYVELIHYVMDKKGYQEKYNKQAETKATSKTWNFIKGNGAVDKKGIQTSTNDNKKVSKIDFSGAYKK